MHLLIYNQEQIKECLHNKNNLALLKGNGSGGAVIGASIPFLGPFTPFAGSWTGGWLGDQLMNGIDNMWNKSWDDKF